MQRLHRHLSLLPSPSTLLASLRKASATAAAAASPIASRGHGIGFLTGMIRAPTTATCFFSAKPSWATAEEWGEERRADSQRQDVAKQYVVHLHPRKNNTFVTVTDADGNKKYSASVGSLHLGKGSNVPRFFAEPVAEHAGQAAVKLGIKSAVVKVKGAVFFKKKKDAVLSFRKGTRSAGMDQVQITSIQDVTRLAHNGCRLRKKRRI